MEEEEEEEEYTNPYDMLVYGIRSSYTKESFFRRLHRFVDSIDLCKAEAMEKRCNVFSNSLSYILCSLLTQFSSVKNLT